MRRIRRALLAATLFGVVVAAGAAPAATAPAATAPAQGQGERSLPRELFSPDGTITPIQVGPDSQPESSTSARVAVSAVVTAVEVNGPSENRIDMVFVGDGYTESELGVYAEQVRTKWELLANRQPFKAYRHLFNVWRVDVVSAVSGVSGDPTPDVVRDTPLGMTYWCDGLERLVCADIEAVHRYAALAPDVDQVGALANSAKYGGAGYTTEEVATFAGGNELAGEIFPHELGHSLGDLADEYDLADGATWTGKEPWEVNVTTRTASELRQARAKWWYWLGAPTPDGGVIGTFEGGRYFEFGIFRPSEDSLMRTLLREYNAVSREKMIQSFYGIVQPIDAVTPDTALLPRKGTVSIRTVVPAGDLRVNWYVDGKEVKRWRGQATVHLQGVPRHAEELTVSVADGTSWVRNRRYRSRYLTQSRTWGLKGD